MNAVAPLAFASAYKQLRPTEKLFVDAYVGALEDEAARANERISNALYRPIDAETVAASRGMLEKPMVLAAITERVTEIAMQSELSVYKIIKEYRSLAFSSVGDYMTVGEDGYPSWDLTKANPDQLAAIQSFDMEYLPRGGIKMKIRLHDKKGSLDALAKYTGLDQPDNPHWRSENARPVNENTALPSDISEGSAADRYSRMING